MNGNKKNMKTYLKIISKQEFTSLYRFGKIPYSESILINSDDASKLLYNAFKALPFFDGDEEYLVIKIDSSSISPENILITDVIEIIPLTRAAKKSFEIKFDNRIHFSDAIYEDIIQQVETYIEIQDKLEGGKSLVNLFLKNNKTGITEKIIEEAYVSRYKGLKSNQIKADFYTHLLVYERYEFFPNTELGYFYDLGEVFAHFKERDTFKGSGFYNFLENNKALLKEKKLSEIIDFIEKSDEINSFKSLLTLDGIKLYLTGVFYLKYKEEVVTKDSVYQTTLPKIMQYIAKEKFYLQENTDALYLLGGFFGFKKFYDDYYDSLNLRIFKNKSWINTTSKENIIKIVTKHDKLESDNNLNVTTVNDDVQTPRGTNENLKVKKITKKSKELTEALKTTIPDSISESIVDPAIIQDTNEVVEVEKLISVEQPNNGLVLIAKEQIDSIFKKQKTDELKLNKVLLSELIAILNPVCSSKKITKNNVIEIINSTFLAYFECPNNNIIRTKNNSSQLNMNFFK